MEKNIPYLPQQTLVRMERMNRGITRKCIHKINIAPKWSSPIEVYLLKIVEEKEEKDKEILLTLLLCRTFQDESFLSKHYLPLEMFVFILEIAGISFVIPKKGDKK
jgi:hypothetical protein